MTFFGEHLPAVVTDKWLIHPTGVGGWIFAAKGDRLPLPPKYAPAHEQFCCLTSDVCVASNEKLWHADTVA